MARRPLYPGLSIDRINELAEGIGGKPAAPALLADEHRGSGGVGRVGFEIGGQLAPEFGIGVYDPVFVAFRLLAAQPPFSEKFPIRPEHPISRQRRDLADPHTRPMREQQRQPISFRMLAGSRKS